MRERLAFQHPRGEVLERAHCQSPGHEESFPSWVSRASLDTREWGYGGLLAFTAVLLLRPQDQLPLLNPLHPAEICAIVGILPMLVSRVGRSRRVFHVTPETVALGVLGAAMLITVPFSIWPGDALQVFFDSYLKILLVFVLMMNTLTTPKRIDRLIWLIVVCCGYIAARAALDYARGVNLVESGRLAGPVGGIFGNPNDLALNMVTFIPAAAILALSRHARPGHRAIAAIVLVLMVAVVVFTKSRGGIVGLLAALTTLIVLGGQVRRGFGVTALVGVILATPFLPQSFWSRMLSIVDEREDRQSFTGSREARRIVMEEGIQTFMERPFTGVGAGQFKNYDPSWRKQRWREAHNILIQVAADLGLVGLAAFAFLLVRAGVIAARARRSLARPRRGARDRLASVMAPGDRRTLYLHTIAMSAGLAGWFACAMFASVAYSWTFYYPLAIVVSTYELLRDRVGQAKTRHE